MPNHLQVFRRARAANIAAGEGRLLCIKGAGAETLYVVGLEELDEVQLCERTARTERFGGREVVGSVILRHLRRLGNANWATANDRPQAGQWGADHSPRASGLHWLALDDGGEYIGEPLLAKVTVEADSVAVQFAAGDVGGFHTDSLHALRDGTVHKIGFDRSIGNLIPTSTSVEARLTWLGEVKTPARPAVRPPLEVAR